MSECKQKKAFTLIELLVVVTIISVLIALLLPALGQAKVKAKAIVCMSNLHQLGMAEKQYSNDYSGVIPVYCYNSTIDRIWYEWLTLGNYVQNKRLLRCPSMRPDESLTEDCLNLTGDYKWETYGMRFPNVLKEEYTIPGPSGWSSSYVFYQIDKVEFPSRYPMIADTAAYLWGYRQFWVFCTQSLYGTGCLAGISLINHSGGFMTGSANIWMADGHVEACNERTIVNLGVTSYVTLYKGD